LALGELERRLVDEIAERRDELVDLASDMIAFDTTARRVGDPPREETAMQEYLAARLEAAGAKTELWEPSPADLAGRPLVPEGLDFDGRPQLVARFPGRGGGRSLLLNGHIDAVSSEPKDKWTSDPNRAEVRDGKLYGRGSNDMKGGIAAMIVAAEVVAAHGLDGELVVATNTDEESSGAGAMALVAQGVGADAGIVTEPTGFDVWIACRGSSYAEIEVPGRPGHAENAQPPWRQGGAVNAIEKTMVVLEEIGRLREDWRSRVELRHPYLSPSDMVPTVIAGGEWPVTYPASCRLTCGVLYVPAQADGDGWGSAVEAEVAERLSRAAATDDWLAEHPPAIRWSTGVMPMEISPEEPIVAATLEAAGDVGRAGELAGLDSWYDGATFTLLGGTPAIAFGPSGFGTAHAIDEYVPVDDLVACAQALAVTAVRFCGRASGPKR
jgi:acetylornithine deacetylase